MILHYNGPKPLRQQLNLPNALTATRIFLVPLLVVVLLTKFEGRLIFGVRKELIGAAIFGLASLTDWLDGYLARRRKQVTVLGQMIDPIADKLLTSAAFISLVQMDLAPAWMVADHHRPRVRRHRPAQLRLCARRGDSGVAAGQAEDDRAGRRDSGADPGAGRAFPAARAAGPAGVVGGGGHRAGVGVRLLPPIQPDAPQAS